MRTVYLNPTAGGAFLTNEQIDELVRGVRLITPPYVQAPRSLKLNSTARDMFEAAKANGYHYAQPSNVAFLAHYWAETNSQPMIRVQVGKKTSTVTMDLVSLPRESREAWRLRESAVFELAAELSGRLEHFGVYTLIRVPRSAGDECARRLVAIYRLCSKPTSEA